MTKELRFSGRVEMVSLNADYAIVSLDENPFRIAHAHCTEDVVRSVKVKNKGFLTRLFCGETRGLIRGDRVSGELRTEGHPYLKGLLTQLPLPEPFPNVRDDKIVPMIRLRVL